MEELNTKLTVNLDGNDVVIDVIDIVESPEYKKEYIFYTIDGVPNQEIFASILNEADNTYSLDTIENDEEFDYVNQLIAKMSLDFEEEIVEETKEEVVEEKTAEVISEEKPQEPVVASTVEQPVVLEETKVEEESVYNITDTKETSTEENTDTNVTKPLNNSELSQASNFDFNFDVEKTTDPMQESDNDTIGE